MRSFNETPADEPEGGDEGSDEGGEGEEGE